MVDLTKLIDPSANDIVAFHVAGIPMPYVRQTQRDKWGARPEVLRYRAWADAIRLVARPWFANRPPFCEPCLLVASLLLPVPNSWSKKRRERALTGKLMPTSRSHGDVDNYLKGVADALNHLAYEDDSQIIYSAGSKMYGVRPGAWIAVGVVRSEQAKEFLEHRLHRNGVH